MIYGFFYRIVMRLAHRFNWHYAPPIYPDGDTQLWCRWCGFRATIKRKGSPMKALVLLLALFMAGCKRAVTVEPPNQIHRDNTVVCRADAGMTVIAIPIDGHVYPWAKQGHAGGFVHSEAEATHDDR